MNRVEIKNKAKEMIRENKWFLWKPLIVFGVIFALIEGISIGLDALCGTTIKVATQTTSPYGYISIVVGVITGIASSAFYVAYAKYVLSFVRGKKLEMSDIVDFMKKHWVVAFLVGLVVGLIVCAGSFLLIIPGIIAAIGLMFYQEVCADNPDKSTMDIVKKSWEMTKGHKMELFVFGLSFFGWILLAPLTLGILYIWLMPYLIVSATLVYEKLK